MTPSLTDFPWATIYRHEDGDLVELFYLPALSRATSYDRLTGYFSADALALAARGLEKLVATGGRMRLVVGCTLSDAEIRGLEDGYDLREKIAAKLLTLPIQPRDFEQARGLELLALMIANGHLDVKVAVPVAANGKPVAATGIYHEKVGVVMDAAGNRIAFSGSVNETGNGWLNNSESFHVSVSWTGGRDAERVIGEVEAFAKVWEGRARSVRVLEFPDAMKARLLEFLPEDDRHVPLPPPLPPPPPALPALLPDEKRRAAWTFIRHAASLPNGRRVGEATSAVRPWPHQVKAYQRMLDEWPCQLLVADEVGLGKTVTAGLFLRQAWLAGWAKRILVLAPKALLTQWQAELYEKFNLAMPIYDGQRLVTPKVHGDDGPAERPVSRGEWHREPFVLTSSQLMRRGDRSPELLQAENWDLIVLDEAHHARRKSPGGAQEGGPNLLLRLMQGLRPKTKSLVLLSATPMQVHPVELWDLLKLLGLPERWAADRHRFLRYFELAGGNPDDAGLKYLAEAFQEIEAAHGAVTEEAVADLLPDLSPLARRKVLRALRDGSGIPLKRLEAGQRRAALAILRRFSPVRHRMIRHTRSLLREYHRRGLLTTPIAERKVIDLPLEMSRSEQALYDNVEKYIAETYNRASAKERSAVGFVMTIYRRRLASSFAALKQTLVNRRRGFAGVTDEDASQDEAVDEIRDADESLEVAQGVHEETASIDSLLKAIDKVGTNTKARVLVEQLEIARADGYDSAIVFTQYTDTLNFLKEHLAAALPGTTVGCYSGEGGEIRDTAGFWTKCSKEQIKQRLKGGLIRLLVCTDAAAEGLNLQFCGVLVNYDLPWNPMKLEQRIGRIDRIGQKHAVIRVINLAYKDTVEADVYFAVGSRIKLFEGLVGRLQPILSRLPKEIEKVALLKPEEREAARHRLLAELDSASQARPAVDVDEIAGDALQLPEVAEPGLTLDDLDVVARRPDLLPPAVEMTPLDFRSFKLQVPGRVEPIRLTTSGEVFDDHFESHALLSPGGRTFEALARDLAGAEKADTAAHVRKAWLARDPQSLQPRFFVAGCAGRVEVVTFHQLMTLLDAGGLKPADVDQTTGLTAL